MRERTNERMNEFVCMYVCMNVCMYVFIYIYTCICKCICVYIYTYSYVARVPSQPVRTACDVGMNRNEARSPTKMVPLCYWASDPAYLC